MLRQTIRESVLPATVSLCDLDEALDQLPFPRLAAAWPLGTGRWVAATHLGITPTCTHDWPYMPRKTFFCPEDSEHDNSQLSARGRECVWK